MCLCGGVVTGIALGQIYGVIRIFTLGSCSVAVSSAGELAFDHIGLSLALGLGVANLVMANKVLCLKQGGG